MPTRRITKKISNPNLELNEVVDIILNVDDYKNFVPHCSYSKILNKKDEEIEAEIAISFSIFKVSYISQIKYKISGNKAEIEVREKYTNTFKKLFNKWIIEVNKDEINVDFFVDFEIKNMLLNKIASASLSITSEIILNAFIKQVMKVKT
jgi:coenzyme Q-binding protein COQ10